MSLYKGSFEQKTDYSVSPAAAARNFEDEGATRILITDLDGAKKGEPQNLRTIAKICESVKVAVDVGGGVRKIEDAEKLFEIGVDRVILGTIAIENLELLKEFLVKFGSEKIVASLAAREGGVKLATRDWQEKTDLDVLDFAEKLEKIGVSRIIYTDIARDGTLTFPNFDIAERLINITKLKILASGGITDLAHLEILRKVGCEGAIIGKALFENEISLEEIFNSLKK